MSFTGAWRRSAPISVPSATVRHLPVALGFPVPGATTLTHQNSPTLAPTVARIPPEVSADEISPASSPGGASECWLTVSVCASAPGPHVTVIAHASAARRNTTRTFMGDSTLADAAAGPPRRGKSASPPRADGQYFSLAGQPEAHRGGRTRLRTRHETPVPTSAQAALSAGIQGTAIRVHRLAVGPEGLHRARAPVRGRVIVAAELRVARVRHRQHVHAFVTQVGAVSAPNQPGRGVWVWDGP